MYILLYISVTALVLCVYLLYMRIVRKHQETWGPGRGRKRPASVMIVVGSGGHTREILQLRSHLGGHYSPRYYMVASTDAISEQKIHFAEQESLSSSSTYVVYKIPRSREVKQSWLSTVLSTVYAALYTCPLVFKCNPQLILCNGPGTCIPVCFVGLILKWVCFQSTVIVYVESICRVKTLSLSGKILYKFADHMFVQWPELKHQYPKYRSCAYIKHLV